MIMNMICLENFALKLRNSLNINKIAVVSAIFINIA